GLERDANNPLALASLAGVYRQLSYFGGMRPSEGMPQAKASVCGAIELDDKPVGAHFVLGDSLYFYDWAWDGAEREFRRALELNPRSSEARSWYGFFLWGRLRYDQALAECQIAVDLDPFSINAMWWQGLTLLSLEQYDTALELGQKMLGMEPH